MNRIEPVAPDQDSRPLNEVELDAVSGGFGFVERGVLGDGDKVYNPSTGAFFLKNVNAS